MSHLTSAQYAGLIQAFSDIDDDLDVLVIDTAAGIGDSVVNFVRAAQEVLIVVCDEPTSIANAYARAAVVHRSSPAENGTCPPTPATITGAPASDFFDLQRSQEKRRFLI